MNTRQVDLAYVAGFFDGEGSIMMSMPKGKHVRVEVAVSQNTRTVLDLHVRFFGGHVYGYAPKKRPRAIMYQWKVYGQDAYEFLIKIEPYLHVKKVEAREGMEIWLQRRNMLVVERILKSRAARKQARLEWLNSLPEETKPMELPGLSVEKSLDS